MDGNLLAIYELVLFTLLYFLCKNKLHQLLLDFFGYLILAFIGINQLFPEERFGKLVMILYVSGFIIFIFFMIKTEIVKMQKKDLWYQPILITFLFLCSHVIGIKTTYLHLPWPTGYALATISFLCGLLIYRMHSTKRGNDI